MNCLEDESICSVNKENNLGYYRLHTIWGKDGFVINITSENGAWRGEMTSNDIAKMSVLLDMKPESYLNQCKKALTCHGGLPGMVYAVENGSFMWKRVEDEDSGIKIKMGSVTLEPTSFIDTIQNLVTAALNCNKNLQEELKKISAEKEKILENKHELLIKLNELIKTKETMENDLYAKFILLVNTKKEKILDLENLLERFKNHKSRKLRNSNDPYEIDTDIDSGDGIQESSVIKMKRKTKEKTEKRSNRLSKGAPEEKRIKNRDYDILSEKSDSETQNYLNSQNTSPKPSTSKCEPGNVQEEVKEISLTKALTKDELYDYFYGEL